MSLLSAVAVGAVALAGVALWLLRRARARLRALDRRRAVLAADEQRRRDELRAAQTRLEDVLGGMTEGVLVVDAGGIVRLCNGRGEVLLDIGRDRPAVGRPLIELTRNPDLHQLVGELVAAGGGRPLVRALPLGGDPALVLQVTATPMPAAPDGQRSFILVFHDVSEMERLNRVRRDFVDNVSHELRTPLAAICGYAETLLAGALDDPERARRFLSIIERHAVRLGRLVDDLLVLSDLELGRTAMARIALPAADVVETTFEVLGPKAERAGLQLVAEIAPGLPPLDADPDRIEQAMVNLVDNAIKYTPAGGRVTVSARLVAAARTTEGATFIAPGGFVELAVADTGAGVPPEDLPRLAERFYRVDKARSRELGGTGLGLAIVKHVVQAHNGWLRIESILGRGTTVRMYLPPFLPNAVARPVKGDG